MPEPELATPAASLQAGASQAVGRLSIRHATMADLDAIADAEARSFPAAEACSRASFAARITAYPNHFWLLEVTPEPDGASSGDARPETETPAPVLASFVNGLVTEQPDLLDEMYDDASFHDPLGSWQMIFGVVTVPELRRRGYAAHLLEQVIADARAQGRAGLVLTCKDALIPYYARFGFVGEGLSTSTHGDVAWHQMRLTL